MYVRSYIARYCDFFIPKRKVIYGSYYIALKHSSLQVVTLVIYLMRMTSGLRGSGITYQVNPLGPVIAITYHNVYSYVIITELVYVCVKVNLHSFNRDRHSVLKLPQAKVH